MYDFFLEYGLFLLKAITVVVSIVMVVGIVASSRSQSQSSGRGNLQVRKMNDQFDQYRDTLREAVMTGSALKEHHKAEKKRKKTEKKAEKKQQATRKSDDPAQRRRVFVLDFDGDIKASAVDHLREAVSGVLTIARSEDEVVVRL